MTAVTLYDVLGVRPAATAAEVRSAYLAAARRAHPDVAGPRGDDAMRDLNTAWAVLGNPEARRDYDLTLPDGPRATGSGSGRTADSSKSYVRRPVDQPFVPYNAVDEDDDDEWRYVDDTTDPETAPGPLIQLAPIAVVVVGMVIAGAGALLRSPVIAALGAVLVALGAIGFLIVPLAVMAKASTVEQRRERERGR